MGLILISPASIWACFIVHFNGFVPIYPTAFPNLCHQSKERGRKICVPCYQCTEKDQKNVCFAYPCNQCIEKGRKNACFANRSPQFFKNCRN